MPKTTALPVQSRSQRGSIVNKENHSVHKLTLFSALYSWMGIAIQTPTALLPLRRFDDVKEQKKREEGNG